MDETRRLDKIKGCLIGGAMGDALGYSVEFMSYNEIKNVYGKNGITEYKLVGGKAIISDDTQMSLFTAVGLLFWKTRIDNHGVLYSPAKTIYLAYLDWLETQGFKGYVKEPISWIKDIKELNHTRAPGNTCLSALTSGKMGTIEQRINNSKGCGGVMRVAPYGLIEKHANPVDAAMEAAHYAAITHGHDLAIIPSALLAHIIQSIMNIERAEKELINIIIDSLASVCEMFKDSKYINNFKELIILAINLSQQNNEPIDAIRKLGEGWVGDEAIAIAIYSVLKAKTFEGALFIAVNHDGDSDSTGAIAGNILGAWCGYDFIPNKFKENLELLDVMLEIAEDLSIGCPFDEYSEQKDFKWIKKYMPYY